MIDRAGAAFLVLITVMLLASCERKPDRLVTSDGRVLAGRLEHVSGASVRISGEEMTLEHDSARLFMHDREATCRGYIEYSDGVFTVTEGGRSVEVPGDRTSSIIWSGPSSEEAATVEVPAVAGWVETGIDLEHGDRLVVEASGRVSIETGTCGPSGIDYFSTAMALVPGATNGQLVMKVGDNAPVAGGDLWYGDSPGEGELMVAVNRPNRESVAGVGGAYTVTVTRTPGVLGHSVLFPSPD